MNSKREFIFAQELWEDSERSGCYIADGNLCVTKAENEYNSITYRNGMLQKAIFISYALDSNEKETIWNRVVIDFPIGIDHEVEISAFASDDFEIEHENSHLNLENFIKNEHHSIEEKNVYLNDLWQNKVVNKKEMSLQMCKGKYLWFKIEVTYFKVIDICINFLKIEFPLRSITSYLPNFYTNNDENSRFLKSFLAPFQSIIYDMQDEIENISKYFDLDYVDNDYLKWLSKWVGGDLSFLHTDENIRDFVKKSFRLYQKKGTKICLQEVLALFLGEDVIIFENFELKTFSQLELFELYSDDIYKFFVIIKESDKEKIQQIEEIIKIFKPAHAKAVLIILKQSFILGHYTYLEINSCIAMNEALILTDNGTIPFDSTIID